MFTASAFEEELGGLLDHHLFAQVVFIEWAQPRSGEGLLPRLVAYDEQIRRRGLRAPVSPAHLRSLRRGLSLDWWYVPYGASMLLRRHGDMPHSHAVAAVREHIDAAWHELSRRLRPEILPPLSALQRSAPCRYEDNAAAAFHAVNELRLLYGLAPTDVNDIAQRLAELYDLSGSAATPPERSENHYETLAYIPHAPIEPERLEGEWYRVQAEIQLLVDTHRVRGEPLLYHPQLDVLKSRILSEWTWLSEPFVFSSCLTLIDQMKGNFAVTWLALNCLKVALILSGDSWRAEQVGAREMTLLADSGYHIALGERRRGLVHPATTAHAD